MRCQRDPEHEQLLNFINEVNGSKVLLSSRVRKTLEHNTNSKSSPVVTIELPNEEDAVKMLLSIAGLPTLRDAEAPPQARDLVRFCKFLPLSISIAGKLVADAGIGVDAAEWDGVVELMQESASDDKRSVEESVILASLNSIRGGQKENITHLFKSLALLPEDAVAPLPLLSLMYQATLYKDGSQPRPPSILSTRLWIKQLIDRSLVLGTVDRPALHGEFTPRPHCNSECQR